MNLLHASHSPAADPLNALARDVISVTSAVVGRSFLAPSMDAIALSRDQDLVAFNPSRERDSLAEWIPWLRRREPEAAVALAELTGRFVRLNREERGHVRSVAGVADALTRDLRAMELRGRGFPLTGKRIAGLVREPLDVIARPLACRKRYVTAVRAVDAVLAQAPRALTLSGTVEHELGRARFDLLTELAEAYYPATADA